MRILVLLLVGCGRIGFDPIGGGVGPTDNLRAWWRLDEGMGTVAHDEIGGADGGIGLATSWVAGHHGSALMFQSTSDALAVGTPATLANLTQISVSAWSEPTTLIFDGSTRCVFDKGNGIAGWSFVLSRSLTGSLAFSVHFGSTILSAESIGNAVVVDGAYHHVVATWDGGASATGVHFYVDAAEVQSLMTSDGVGPRVDDSASTAAINCNAATKFVGALDDVRIYESALSQGDVSTLYAL